MRHLLYSGWKRAQHSAPLPRMRAPGRSTPASGVAVGRRLDEREAEAALDAEVPAGHRDVGRRGHLHDPIVLHVEREGAAHAAVGADRIGRSLLRLVPRAGRTHVVLALEHESAGRADADAVAAIDAGGVGQWHVGLGRDAGVEASTGHRDGERILGVDAARLDALVAENALAIVAQVEIVV